MGTKLPSTLLTKYHKLNKIHSRVLHSNGLGNFLLNKRSAAVATNLKRDTFRHFGSMIILQSSKIKGLLTD